MEWVVLVVVGLVVLGWWLGRGSSDSTSASAPGIPRSTPVGRPTSRGPLTEAAAVIAGATAGGVLREAPGHDDSGGAFMNGYVVGRLAARDARPPVAEPADQRDQAWFDDDPCCRSDDPGDEEYLGGESSADPDAYDDDMSDDW